MAKTLSRPPDTDLYETDHYRWLEEQAALLREGRLEDIDASNLIEEFDELAAGERASIESHAGTILEHLLKHEHSPADRPRRGWRLAVTRHRARLAKRLSSTLRRHFEGVLEEVYKDARRAAAIGLEPDRLPPDQLPAACPYTLDEVLDPEWLPDSRHGLHDSVPEPE